MYIYTAVYIKPVCASYVLIPRRELTSSKYRCTQGWLVWPHCKFILSCANDSHNPATVLLCMFVHETILGVAPLPQVVVLHQATDGLFRELGGREGGREGERGGRGREGRGREGGGKGGRETDRRIKHIILYSHYLNYYLSRRVQLFIIK